MRTNMQKKAACPYHLKATVPCGRIYGTFADIISRAEDLYVPSAPPMSPLTKSYFTCWAFFDACAGPANETIGTTILETGAAFGMHPELLRRSEEHTSELQSRLHLVCRLLLEKK